MKRAHGWANYEQYETMMKQLRDATQRYLARFPTGSSPPTKTPSANKCPGCARKIPDNKKHCGRPKCWSLVEGDTSVDADALANSVDAMHRQRGCGPFSLGWRHRPD